MPLYCRHVQPHEVKMPTSRMEAWILYRINAGGWFNAGYCPGHYPEWLYREWAKEYAKIEPEFDAPLL